MKRYLVFIIIILLAAILGVVTVFKNKQKDLPVPDFLKFLTAKPTIVITPPPAEDVEISFSLEGEVQDNLPPVCLSLSANKTIGKSPLMVNFTGSGEDQDEKISAFEFDFGDGGKEKVEKASLENKQTTTANTSYTYKKAGTYTASLKVFDNKNSESVIPNVCQVKITVTSTIGGTAESTPAVSPTPTKTPAPTLMPKPTAEVDNSLGSPLVPEAGGFLPTFVTILGGGAIVILALLL